jgi:threonine dehydrogenase-like Zn-dependent dehydrogenase
LNTVTARQFWIRSPGHAEIVTRDLPGRQEGEATVRTIYSGISRGTEALVFNGGVPASLRASMRAPFQEGDFPGPVKYGYASVGEVTAGPPDLVGETVFCLHPHQDVYHVPAAAVVRLPEGVPAGRAVLAANAETALNGVWDGRAGPGDRIVVVGAGVVGLLTAWLMRMIPGTDVVVHDLDEAKEPAARALGLAFTTRPPVGHDADLVVHASGSPDGLVTSLAAAGLEATVLEMSWFGDRSVPLPLGEAFHARRLVLRSSQVGRVPANRAARWSTDRRLRTALSLLTDDSLDVLITGESDFDELPRVMPRLSRSAAGTLCHRVRY